MPTPTLYMNLPNPTVGGDATTWGNEVNTCYTALDALAVYNLVSVSASGSLVIASGPSLVQATGGSLGITLTLPDVTNGGANAKNMGRVYAILKVDSGVGAITVNPFSGGQTISGQSSLTISSQWLGYIIQSTATGWVVLSLLTSASGIVPVSEGGTGANLSATGGTNQVVQQSTLGGVFTVGQLSASQLSNGTAGSGAVVLANTPTLITPVLGVATATSINGLTITSSTGTLTIANGKTATVNNSLTFAGTDATTMTFPSTSASIARTDAAQTFTGLQTFSGAISVGTTISSYNGMSTSGNGVAAIVAATSQKSESAADANVLTFTPPASAGSYRVRFVMSVSAANAATLGWTITYKDSNGNSQTPTNLALNQVGSAPAALTFTTSAAGNYYGAIDIDIDNSATNVVVQLTFSGTSFAAKVSSTIARII